MTPSDPAVLVLHAVRLLGGPSPEAVGRRFGLDRWTVIDQLEDDEARGWVRRFDYPGISGWTLTETGRVENERRLAAELDATGARPVVEAAADAFTELNARPVVDAPGGWSCHAVWMELHEDLLATLGRARGGELADG